MTRKMCYDQNKINEPFPFTSAAGGAGEFHDEPGLF